MNDSWAPGHSSNMTTMNENHMLHLKWRTLSPDTVCRTVNGIHCSLKVVYIIYGWHGCWYLSIKIAEFICAICSRKRTMSWKDIWTPTTSVSLLYKQFSVFSHEIVHFKWLCFTLTVLIYIYLLLSKLTLKDLANVNATCVCFSTINELLPTPWVHGSQGHTSISIIMLNNPCLGATIKGAFPSPITMHAFLLGLGLLWLKPIRFY